MATREGFNLNAVSWAINLGELLSGPSAQRAAILYVRISKSPFEDGETKVSKVSKIIRGPKLERNFYILDKNISEDPCLSWEARGVLIFLLGKPDDWKVSVAHLISVGSAKRDKIYRIISELIAAGYCSRIKGPKGHGCDYVLTECPHTDNPEVEVPLTENPLPVKPFTPEATQISTDNKQEVNKTNKKNIQKKCDLDWSAIQLSEKQKADIRGIRIAAKVKLTQLALDFIIKEFHLASTAGIGFDESIGIWAVRGWKAYKADWALNHKGVKDGQKTNGAISVLSDTDF